MLCRYVIYGSMKYGIVSFSYIYFRGVDKFNFEKSGRYRITTYLLFHALNKDDGGARTEYIYKYIRADEYSDGIPSHSIVGGR